MTAANSVLVSFSSVSERGKLRRQESACRPRTQQRKYFGQIGVLGFDWFSHTERHVLLFSGDSTIISKKTHLPSGLCCTKFPDPQVVRTQLYRCAATRALESVSSKSNRRFSEPSILFFDTILDFPRYFYCEDYVQLKRNYEFCLQ